VCYLHLEESDHHFWIARPRGEQCGGDGASSRIVTESRSLSGHQPELSLPALLDGSWVDLEAGDQLSELVGCRHRRHRRLGGAG
jgi:hypothetical protein